MNKDVYKEETWGVPAATPSVPSTNNVVFHVKCRFRSELSEFIIIIVDGYSSWVLHRRNAGDAGSDHHWFRCCQVLSSTSWQHCQLLQLLTDAFDVPDNSLSLCLCLLPLSTCPAVAHTQWLFKDKTWQTQACTIGRFRNLCAHAHNCFRLAKMIGVL